MSFFHTLFRVFDRIAPAEIVHAHCDIPCGIYDPKAVQIAAQTVAKMIEKIGELKAPDPNDKKAYDAYHNSITRFVTAKEEHAHKCKTELLILWTDYFKPAHLETFPNLHDTFWKAAKLCSQNKQEVSMDAAKALQKAVDDIADIFAQTKK